MRSGVAAAATAVSRAMAEAAVGGALLDMATVSRVCEPYARFCLTRA
jgi:hypothetical protein